MRKAFADYNDVLVALNEHNMEAFDYLYEDARVWLYGVAYSIIEDESASQDLVQDFFIDFWKQRLYQNIKFNLKGYLVRSVRHRALNYIARSEFRNRPVSLFQYLTALFIPPSRIEQLQTQEAIQAALKKVSKSSAEVFSLHYVKGLSHAQIAEKLGVSPHTVRNHVSKALRILRSELKNVHQQ